MENEREVDFSEDHSEHSDEGYSEDRLAKQFDKGTSSAKPVKGANLFIPQKKSQTVFQAQKKVKK